MILIASRIPRETHKVDFNYIAKTYGTNIATTRIGRNNIAIVCKSNIDDITALKVITSVQGNIIKANGYGQKISNETYAIHRISSSSSNKAYILYEEIATQK